MKKLSSILIFLVLLAGCASKAEKNLQDTLKRYSNCYARADYICMASMLPSEVIKKGGGVEALATTIKRLHEALNRQGIAMHIEGLRFGKPGRIVQHNDYMVSVVPTEIPVNVKGERGAIMNSIIALSDDRGKTWSLLEGTDEARALIASISPSLIQNIEIPSVRVKVGSIELVQKNGIWIRK